jgi:hypothetical protein
LKPEEKKPLGEFTSISGGKKANHENEDRIAKNIYDSG